MSLAGRRRLPTVTAGLAVFGLHGLLLLLLWRELLPAPAPQAAPGADRLSLQLDLRQRSRPAAARAPAKLMPQQAVDRALAMDLPRPTSGLGGDPPGQPPAAEEPAAEARPQALDLRLPSAGPHALRTRPADLRELMRGDPRANSPRLGQQERTAQALGTPCFVDERDADGVLRRHVGRWVAQVTSDQSISSGVAMNLGVGGKAPPVVTPRCERAF